MDVAHHHSPQKHKGGMVHTQRSLAYNLPGQGDCKAARKWLKTVRRDAVCVTRDTKMVVRKLSKRVDTVINIGVFYT